MTSTLFAAAIYQSYGKTNYPRPTDRSPDLRETSSPKK
jgi:hypothetical protein